MSNLKPLQCDAVGRGLFVGTASTNKVEPQELLLAAVFTSLELQRSATRRSVVRDGIQEAIRIVVAVRKPKEERQAKACNREDSSFIVEGEEIGGRGQFSEAAEI